VGEIKNLHLLTMWRSHTADIYDAPHPRRSADEGYRGRSPDSRIVLLANAFPAADPPVADAVGFRPRIQWRVHEGIAPSSPKFYLYSNQLLQVTTSISLDRIHLKEIFSPESYF